MNNITLHVDSIVCANCASTIVSVLKSEHPALITALSVDISEKNVHIQLSDSSSLEKIISTLKEIGHNPQLVLNNVSDTKQDYQQIYYLMMGIIMATTGAVLMICHSLPLGFNFFPLLCASLAIPGILVAGYWIFKNAWHSLFMQKTLTMDVLFALSLSVIILSSLMSLFVPALGMPMLCHSGLMIVGFRNLGKFVNEQITRVINISTRVKVKPAPSYFTVDGKALLLKNIKKGMRLSLDSNDVIPVEGKVISGTAYVDEKAVTGELLPQKKDCNQLLYSGTQIQSGKVVMETTNEYSESLYFVTQNLLQEAIKHPPRIESMTNKIIKIYLPSVLAFAIITGALMAFFNPIQGIIAFISILVGSCPCILGLISPLCIKLGINLAKQNQIVVKNARALEQLHTIDAFVFDKTGTLTELNVKHYETFNPLYNEEKLQAIAAQLESDEHHPIAKAILKHANLNALSKIEKNKYPNGISAKINGHRYFIGNAAGVLSNSVTLNETMKGLLQHSNQPTLFILEDNNIIGLIHLHETIRSDAKDFITELKQHGKQVFILTGSESTLAKNIGHKLGIHNIHPEMTPQDKISFIDKLNQSGLRVAMIGDGENDEPALAKSLVNISFIDADPSAIERSGILLPTQNTFKALSNLCKCSKLTVKNITQNILLCLSFGLLSLAFGVCFALLTGAALNPAFSALLMLGQIGLIVTNIYRFKFTLISNSNIKSDNSSLSRLTTYSSPTLTHKISPAHEISQNTKSSPMIEEVLNKNYLKTY